MKARESRALLRQVRSLSQAGALQAARELVERTRGAFEDPKLRNAYAVLLRELGDTDGFLRTITETIKLFPDDTYAARTIIEFDKGTVHHEAELAQIHGQLDGTASDSVFLARAAAMSASRRDVTSSWEFGRRSLDGAHPAIRQPIRQTLASLFLWHGQHDLAERLVGHGRDGEHHLNVVWDLVRLRAPAIYDEQTTSLFRQLIETDSPHRNAAISRYFDYRWHLFGASAELLEQSHPWEIHFPDDDTSLRCARIALAYELEERDRAAAMLAEAPAAAMAYRRFLPVAKLLHDAPSLAGKNEPDPGVEQFATLYDDLVAGTEQLEKKLKDQALRVAIVGNSACEMGLSRGPEIDGHDVVVRFNKATRHVSHAADYGSRTDLHVLPIRGHADIPMPSQAQFIMFATLHPRGRNRDWGYALRLRHQGKILATIEGNGFGELARQLGAPPSNGLRVCAHLRALRGPLPPASCFGFSFTDQIGPQANSSHYFEQAVPAMHHNWPKERELFQSLLRVDGHGSAPAGAAGA